MKTFAVVLNIPSPYRVHLLEELNRQLAVKGIRLEAHFMAKGHPGRPKSWLDPKMTFAYTYWPDHGKSHYHFNPRLVKHLRKNRPDWLLFGSPFDTFTGLAIAFRVKSPSKGCWIEGNTQNPGKLTGFIGWLKRAVLKQCDYVAVPGKEGLAYIDLHRALTKDKLPRCVLLPNLVDETRFRPGKGSEADDKICLIPSRLSPEKGVLPFVRLLDRDMLKDWKIVILGKGEEEESVRQVAEAGGFASRIEILDYVPYDKMPDYYANADLMLLPSFRDQNPLAVIEALHSGLPIALTDQAGNIAEALTEGRNGWSLPINDSEKFRAKIREVFATSRERLREMGWCSLEENAKFWRTPEAIAAYLKEIGV